MEESAMENAASFLITQYRLDIDHPDFQLIFMREEFLTTLWDLLRGAEVEIEKRGTYLAEFFVKLIRDQKTRGYCLLEEISAKALIQDILREDPIQQPIDATKLRQDLRRQMLRAPTGDKKR
jgi:hypothetical protein